MGKTRKVLNMAQERTIGRLKARFDTSDYTVPSINSRGTAKVRFKRTHTGKRPKIVRVSKRGHVVY